MLGAGDDTVFQGDGFDTVDGQSGKDRLLAAGSADSRGVHAAGASTARRGSPATPARRRPTRTAIETLDVNAAGGQDLIDIGDLAPSDVLAVEADLGLLDGARDADRTSRAATSSTTSACGRSTTTVRVEGLDATIRIENARATEDALTVFGRGGTDFISAEDASAAHRADVRRRRRPGRASTARTRPTRCSAGPTATSITGGKGNDTVDLGDGDDFFTRGAGGRHRPRRGRRRRPTRSARPAARPTSRSTSRACWRARACCTGSPARPTRAASRPSPCTRSRGTDNVTVRDLTRHRDHEGRRHALDRRPARRHRDRRSAPRAPTRSRRRRTGRRRPSAACPRRSTWSIPSAARRSRSTPATAPTRSTPPGSPEDKIQPILKGGAGNDTIIGSSGDDTIAGGVGVDVALMGGGLDTFTWGPGEGNDIVEGQGRHRLPADERLGRQRPLRRRPGRRRARA